MTVTVIGAPTVVAGAPTATTVEVNLGSSASRVGSFTITDAAITTSSTVSCWQAPGPYTGKGTRADEAEMQPVLITAVVPGSGSALVRWRTPSSYVMTPATLGRVAHRGLVRGNVKFSYTIFS